MFQTSLKSQLIEKKSECQSVQSECDILRGKLICRDEELDDIRCQFTSVNNALEVTKPFINTRFLSMHVSDRIA